MSIPNTMKAAVCKEGSKTLSIEEVAVPRPSKGQILVKIEACGVCHTDLHAIEGDWPVKPKTNLIPGHEGVGKIVELGEGVTHLNVGDIVGIPWLYSACGHCEHCFAGWETLCESQQNGGYSVNGGFAQYAVADADYVGIFDKNLSHQDLVNIAPILCAGVTVYKGLRMTEARPGEWVTISGIGGLGHLAVQYAKAMGFRIAAVDVADDKLELAKEYGAEVVANAKTENVVEKIRNATSGGTHGVLVTAVSPKAFEQAVAIARRGGTVAMNGLPPGEFPVSIFNMILNGITVRGSIVGTRLDLQKAIEFAQTGRVKAHTTAVKLEQINEVFDKMKKGQIEGRMVLDME
ncbi:alcohol dehydrogenase AdhP [Campylobacter sp. MIT 21-1685]|uniref:alcohol dehydrogenase AdhP n=1 Tax=unclassified Campylobacter TaxID=2593542 RepID=UPI00224A6D0D|nr:MULTISPECIES: alcohol dehydrogenase AdhP [unclassified Campylobacter]MCX2683166.1 alcohol dehydrogenase AdhP [Campylobacter sp. MIT 21-1684]MCX2751375.1 alcohol dehydrogenase AdhP [Campylobacter sp. MIT 21-1682]MCX2807574.1 alcohol dehydrogenase AdhP [Campylobacter sp. MIT 21-1685]